MFEHLLTILWSAQPQTFMKGVTYTKLKTSGNRLQQNITCALTKNVENSIYSFENISLAFILCSNFCPNSAFLFLNRWFLFNQGYVTKNNSNKDIQERGKEHKEKIFRIFYLEEENKLLLCILYITAATLHIFAQKGEAQQQKQENS